MKTKILLCINNKLGLKVEQFLKKKKTIEVITLSTSRKSKFTNIIKSRDQFNKVLSKMTDLDFLITVYWPWLVDKKNFKKFKNSINFHPSFLPYGRGWYPHVYSAIYKIPYGVSLHQINENIDNGKIWCQKRIKIKNFIKGDEIHKIAQNEILRLFKTNFSKIIKNKIKPKIQNKKLKYLDKNWTDKIDRVDLSKKKKIIDLINLIKIRTYKNKNFLYFLDKNKKKNFINIELKKKQ